MLSSVTLGYSSSMLAKFSCHYLSKPAQTYKAGVNEKGACIPVQADIAQQSLSFTKKFYNFSFDRKMSSKEAAPRTHTNHCIPPLSNLLAFDVFCLFVSTLTPAQHLLNYSLLLPADLFFTQYIPSDWLTSLSHQRTM